MKSFCLAYIYKKEEVRVVFVLNTPIRNLIVVVFVFVILSFLLLKSFTWFLRLVFAVGFCDAIFLRLES